MANNRLDSLLTRPSGFSSPIVGNDAASEGSYSRRTFSSNSAPSPQLSYHRDVHMHTEGRAINWLGRQIADPIDNFVARREVELRKVLNHLESIRTEEELGAAARVFRSPYALPNLLEPGR
jgi:hypothetical protein